MKRGAKKFNKLISKELLDLERDMETWIYIHVNSDYGDVVVSTIEEHMEDRVRDFENHIKGSIRTNRIDGGIKYHLGSSRNFDRLSVTSRILEELC